MRTRNRHRERHIVLLELPTERSTSPALTLLDLFPVDLDQRGALLPGPRPQHIHCALLASQPDVKPPDTLLEHAGLVPRDLLVCPAQHCNVVVAEPGDSRSRQRMSREDVGGVVLVVVV